MVRMGSLHAGLMLDRLVFKGRAVDAADDETREVYARYGLAIYFAQVVEHAVVNLMIALRLPERGGLTQRDIDQFMDEAFAMTFGRLAKELRRMGQPTRLVERDLNQARDLRNWLAHRYFRDRAVQFMSPAGRAAMLEELDDATNSFLRVNESLERLSAEIRAANNVSEDAVRQEYGQLLLEVRQWRPD
jgi:hypothetical protein